VLTVLKIVFLALLYFFIYRAIRSVVADLRRTPVRAPTRGEGHAPQPPSRAPSSGKPKEPRSIVVIDENGTKKGTHQLNGVLQIGRADACHIPLTDTYVSQFHARIFPRDGGWFVEDLGSTNGTYLNQRRITGASQLHAGDRVKLGKTTLEVRR